MFVNYILSIIYINYVAFLDFIVWVITLLAVAFLCGVIPVAFYTLMERRIMAGVQRRVGPNIVGFWGVLQPVADGVKLMAKEHIMPRQAAVTAYYAAPVVCISLSYLSWFYVPLGVYSDFENDFGLFILFAVSALSSYGVILAGWSSYSRYAVMGSLRAIAQLISYEVVLLLMVFPLVVFSGSYRLGDIVFTQTMGTWFFVFCLPAALMFYVIVLAETNRTPFDLPEAEAELVSGFNVEYSSMLFAMFSLAEYNSMLIMSAICAIFFLGGWSDALFIARVVLVAVSLVLVRALLPRYRYDQLMSLCWRTFLPFGLGFLLFVCGIAFVCAVAVNDSGFIYISALSLLESDSVVCFTIPSTDFAYLGWLDRVRAVKTYEELVEFLEEVPTEYLYELPFPELVPVEEKGLTGFYGLMLDTYITFCGWAEFIFNNVTTSGLRTAVNEAAHYIIESLPFIFQGEAPAAAYNLEVTSASDDIHVAVEPLSLPPFPEEKTESVGWVAWFFSLFSWFGSN